MIMRWVDPVFTLVVGVRRGVIRCGIVVEVEGIVITSRFEDLVAFRVEADICDFEIWTDADNVQNLKRKFFQVTMDGVVDVR